jgi:N-acetylmuramoyl-L-alanine amidase
MARIVLFVLLVLSSTVARASTFRGVRIVIDPGHGGSNFGARGAQVNALEKALTLRLAKQTQDALWQLLPGAAILLTREDDRYLTLKQRVEWAVKSKAQLFLSLHFNACESHTEQGFETYLLSEGAATAEAQSIAWTRATKTADSLQAILASLGQQGAHKGSLLLARAIQAELRQIRGSSRDRGIRQAPFDVLLGLPMPAVLVELGFIDHEQEGPAIARPVLQRRIAQGLARAVRTMLRRQISPGGVESPLPRRALNVLGRSRETRNSTP